MKFTVAVLLAFGLCGISLSWQRPPLVEVPSHDLSQLEPEVREQIKSHQDLLTATLKEASASDAKLSSAYGKLGEIYHAYSLLSAAEQCYMNASRLASNEFRWNYLLAKVQQAQGHAEPAIRSYQVATTLQMSFVPGHINLGNLYLELNRLDEAKARFGLALQKEPNNAAAHYGLGQVALSKRDYAEAVRQLEKTVELVPEANRIHYPLALAYRGLGDIEKAKAHLARQGTVGVRVDDPFVDHLAQLLEGMRVHMIRGKAALESKRYEEAAAEFRKAIESEPANVSAKVNLGGALTLLGDLQGAAREFEKALKIDAHNLTAHFNLAIVLARDNQHQNAIDHLHQVLSLNPNEPGARLFLARELSQANRVDEALVEYSRLVEVQFDYEAAVIERSQLLQNKGDFKSALDGIAKAHNQYPEKPNIKALLSYLLATTEITLRDGHRALKLAQELYSTTASIQNGRLVILALAETGRCREAGEWQQKLITQANAEGNLELAKEMKEDLPRYQNAACRP